MSEGNSDLRVILIAKSVHPMKVYTCICKFLLNYIPVITMETN